MKAIGNSDAVRRLVVGVACLGISALLGGCHRRIMPPILPPVMLSPSFPPSVSTIPVMKGSLPDIILKAPRIKVTEAKPKRISRRTTSKGATPETSVPVDVPGVVPAPEGASIGELSDGGNSSPRTQQRAAQLITSSEQRLNGLPQSIASQQQAQLRRVRNFLRQAKQALNTGDAEGAMTLATKAKLLIDDIAK